VWNHLPLHEREDFLEDLNSFEHDLMDSVTHNPPSSTISLSKTTPRNARTEVYAPPRPR
jgi:hypothetical protein